LILPVNVLSYNYLDPSTRRSHSPVEETTRANAQDGIVQLPPLEFEELNDPSPLNQDYNYSDVLVVYNENSGISTRVAQYFQNARDIPSLNMCNITTATSETVSRTEFENIRGQIEDYLENNNLTDVINFIVTTKGVPLRVSGSNWQNACLDSELTMILGDYKSNIANGGWFINPYFQDNEPFTREKYSLYLVTRLTAFTEQEIYHIIDNATISLGNRGTYVLDADASKGWSPGGYGDGNIWLRDANISLTNKGIPSYYEDTNTYVKSYPTPVMGYSSWGSNDGFDTANFVSNWNLESVTNNFPSNWYPILDPGINDSVSLNMSDSWSGSRSVQINRTATSANFSGFAQNVTIKPNVRYYLRGFVNVSSLSGPRGAHLQLQALDNNNNILKVQDSQVWTSVSSTWVYLKQLIYEPVPGAVKVRIVAMLNRSAGVVYFDSIRFWDIPPHFTWVPGSIAETFVSTGGRSFRYGTSYGQSLVADLLRDGVTGVKGYVYEPFLSAIAHPDILYDRYTDGYTMAESYYMASNFIGWMGVVVGDPKMAPYADILPDINVSVEGITYSPGNPNIGDWLTIRARVSNLGVKNVSNVQAEVYLVVDGEEILLNEYYIDTLPGSGGTSLIEKSYKLDFWGDAYIRIKIDTISMIKEMDETNNMAEKKIYVNAEADASELTCLNETIYRGEQIVLIANGSDPETAKEDLIPTLEARHQSEYIWFEFDSLKIDYEYRLELENWRIAVSTNHSMLLGNYSFRISFADGNDFTGFHYYIYNSLEVLNNVPVINSVGSNKSIINRTEMVNLTCQATDIENTPESLIVMFQYRKRPANVESNLYWELIEEEEIFFDPSSQLWYLNFEFESDFKPGDYQIRCRAIDQNSGKSDWSYIEPDIEVFNNRPEVNNILVEPTKLYRMDSTDILISGYDIEDQGDLDDLICELEAGIYIIDEDDSEILVWDAEYIDDLEYDFFEDGWLTTFTPSLEALTGEYLFRARIMDLDGNWSSWFMLDENITVLNIPPEARQNKIPNVVKEDTLVSFSGKDSQDPEDGANGLSYHWEISNITDLTITDPNFKYTFTNEGTYTISLRVMDQDGGIAWDNKTIKIENFEPEAIITSTQIEDINIPIKFSAEESIDTPSDLDILTYIWDFGDGENGSGMIVNHTYTVPGTYKVVLTVIDDDGASDTTQMEMKITSHDPPPPDDSDESSDQVNYTLPLVIFAVILIFIILFWIFVRLRKREHEDEYYEPEPETDFQGPDIGPGPVPISRQRPPEMSHLGQLDQIGQSDQMLEPQLEPVPTPELVDHTDQTLLEPIMGLPEPEYKAVQLPMLGPGTGDTVDTIESEIGDEPDIEVDGEISNQEPLDGVYGPSGSGEMDGTEGSGEIEGPNIDVDGKDFEDEPSVTEGPVVDDNKIKENEEQQNRIGNEAEKNDEDKEIENKE
jgi:uncharacterized protein (TIGR03790 family)